MDALTYITEKQYEIQYRRIEKELRQQKVAVKKPTAFLLGGQPGSGKTTLHTLIQRQMNNNVITIDNDRYKTYHPNYAELEKKYGKEVTQLVTPFSNRITEKLIELLSSESYNLIIEGTLRTIGIPIQTAKLLQTKGYMTNLYVMAVPKTISYLSTLERYEDMYVSDPATARSIFKSVHDEIVSKLPNNLDSLFRKSIFRDIRLYTRESECIYSSKETPSKSPKSVITDNLEEKLSKKQLESAIKKLVKKMIDNQHTNTSEFQQLNKILKKLDPPSFKGTKILEL